MNAGTPVQITKVGFAPHKCLLLCHVSFENRGHYIYAAVHLYFDISIDEPERLLMKEYIWNAPTAEQQGSRRTSPEQGHSFTIYRMTLTGEKKLTDLLQKHYYSGRSAKSLGCKEAKTF